jgi:LysM repeat protein
VSRRAQLPLIIVLGLMAGPLGACTAGDGGALPAPAPKLTILPEANAAPPVGIVTTTSTTQPPTTTSLPGSQTYTVDAGDTLTKIANRYGTTVATLLALNRLADPNNIAVGQRIVVPPPVSTTTTAPADGPGTSVATTTPADTATTGGDDGEEDGPAAGGPSETVVTESTASTLPAATENG